MKGKSIIVIGSSNTDMVIRTREFPKPGETLLGGEFFLFPGGKGANQAVAAVRLGGDVGFIAKIGDDIFGKQAIVQFEKEGIKTKHILTDREHPSGVALITVDAKGENTIVVASGSNARLTSSDVDVAAGDIRESAIVLLQLEIPLDTVIHAAKLAREAAVRVILNPAPASELPEELLANIEVITPNETEAAAITGIAVDTTESAFRAGRTLLEKGVRHAIITMGHLGACVVNTDGQWHVPAPKTNAVDTTAAGDVFNGALAVALAEGMPLIDAVNFSNHAAAISVTRMGAQSSAPYRKELANQ